MLRSNSKSLGNHVVSPEEETEQEKDISILKKIPLVVANVQATTQPYMRHALFVPTVPLHACMIINRGKNNFQLECLTVSKYLIASNFTF